MRHNPKKSASYMNPSEDILYFSLGELLPPGSELTVNAVLGTVSLLSVIDGRPRMLVEEIFTSNEMYVVMPLLESFPYYSPHEVLYASYTYGRTTEEAVEKARERLNRAQATAAWDSEVRPVRNVLSRARLKLHSFGIDASSILNTGYILMSYRAPLQLVTPPSK